MYVGNGGGADTGGGGDSVRVRTPSSRDGTVAFTWPGAEHTVVAVARTVLGWVWGAGATG